MTGGPAQPPAGPPSNGANNHWAIALMIGAGALVAATSLIAKALGNDWGDATGLHGFQVSAGRFLFGFCTVLAVLALMPKFRPGFQGADWRQHLLRSVCGWLGVTCMFTALALMPVAEATAISFLSPLVTMVLAALMLGEHIGLRKLLAAALAILGAGLILRPGTEAFQAAGLFALGAAFFMGVEAIFIKRLADREPAFRILLINNAIGAAVSVTVAAFVWTWPAESQWLLLVCLGAVMICGQTCFLQSMKRGEASLVIPAFYSVLVFAAAYDLAIYGVLPAWTSVLGAGLIVSGAVILVLRTRSVMGGR